MPSIGVYAIMKNESTNGDLDRWIACATEADVVVVLDTGSDDDTVERLVAAGIEVHGATFRPFRFDDALNAALGLLPEVDIAVRLDGDETILNVNARRLWGWADEVRSMWIPNLYRLNIRNVNHSEHPAAWGEYRRGFDVHARHGLRWRYPTHEALIGPWNAMDVDNVEIHHWPRPERQEHHSTNIHILGLAAVQEYPNDERMRFYYGREAWYENDWVTAREQLQHFLGMPTAVWDAERAEACRIIAAMDDWPERWLWKAVGECPLRRETWCDLVRHYGKLGDIEGAIWALARAHRCNDMSIYTTQADCWGEGFEALCDMVDFADRNGLAELGS